MDARMLYLHALSPIHSGTGQATDAIDLPVAREKVFGWPYLPGSSVKGVLRDACSPPPDGNGEARKLFTAAFGPDTVNASDGAGSLWFADAHLLCLPVRSYHGTLAWVTCPLALERWRRDHESAGLTQPFQIPRPEGGEAALVAPENAVAADGKLVIEELDLAATSSDACAALGVAIAAALFDQGDAWRDLFQKRFAIVDNDTFSFLCETATEIRARIRLKDETKTVADGAFWYEESVPAESVFYSPLLAMPRNGVAATEMLGLVSSKLGGLLQIGGNASVGQGLVRARLGEGSVTA